MNKLLPVVVFFITHAVAMQGQVMWAPKADFPKCSYEGVSFAIGSTIYYGLGIDCTGGESQAFYKYDSELNTWSSVADFPGPSRRQACAFSLDGKGYVLLGFSSGLALKDVWEYDPEADSWTQKNDFAGLARGAAFCNVVNGKAYIGCGFTPDSTLYPLDLWEYDAATDVWTQKTSPPGNSLLYASRSFGIGDTLYVVGGVGGDLVEAHSEFWAYSSVSDTWEQRPDFPGSPRWYSTAFSMQGVGYCGYGSDFGDFLGDFYAYMPFEGTWTAVPALGFEMLFDGAAVVDSEDRAYCLAGIMESNTAPATTAVWEFKLLPTSAAEAPAYQTSTMAVSPNPTTGFVAVSTAYSGEYVLFNAQGIKVGSLFFNKGEEQQLDLSALAPGLYFICSSSPFVACEKIIIAK